MSCAGVSSPSLALCVCECIIVCVSQEALKGGPGCGAEGVFHSSCTSAGCISLGVPCFLVVREGYHPYYFFFFFLNSPISFPSFPIRSFQKHTHTLLSQEARQRFPATPWQVRPDLAVPADLAAFAELLIFGLNKDCALCLGHVYCTTKFSQSTENYL